MSIRARLLIAKLLISFAAVFIISGTIIEFRTPKIYDPVKDVKIIAGLDKDDISITTSSEDKPVKTTSEEVVVPPVEQVAPPVESSTDTNTNNNISDNLPPVDEPSTSQNNVVLTPSVSELNNQLRSLIKNSYGVDVKYGSETSGYGVGGMSTVALADEWSCHSALNDLNRELSLYPVGFFKELIGKGYPITFYLIQRYSTPNVTGVTDSSSKNIIISIATDYEFADTLHHEVYHYIEKYLIKAGASFASWNSLNPGNFSYGTINSTYAYTKTYSPEAAFVNTYAQTNSAEDRASTFEYMMKFGKAACLNNGSTVWLKARTMSEQIEYFIDSVSPNTTEYWERHLY